MHAFAALARLLKYSHRGSPNPGGTTSRQVVRRLPTMMLSMGSCLVPFVIGSRQFLLDLFDARQARLQFGG